jgi:hypothetical protein
MKKIEVGKKVVAIDVDGKVIVDDSTFAELNVIERGEAVSQFMKAGGAVEFKPDFAFLTNYRELAEKLKKGDDASLELAFNGITLPEGFNEAVKAYQVAVQPVLELVSQLIPKWNFATVPTNAVMPNFGVSRIARNDGDRHYMNVAEAVKIWNKVSKYWAKLAVASKARKPEQDYMRVGGDHRYVSYGRDDVTVGCQTIMRWEWEAAAKHYGWVFPELV